MMRQYVQDLLERAKVAEEDREAEEMRLVQLLTDRVFQEVLEALPEEDVGEIEREMKITGEFSEDKLNSMMFTAGLRPESIVGKVVREIEREYLGVEAEETETEEER